MCPARIQAAENAAASWRFAEAVDCRSHYDPVYDRLIYGVCDEDLPRKDSKTARPISEPTVYQGDWLATFQSLAVPQDKLRPRAQSGALLLRQGGSASCLSLSSVVTASSIVRGMVWATVGMDYPRSIATGFSKWLDQRIDGLTRQWALAACSPAGQDMNWNEYAELMDRAARPGITTPLGAGISARRQTVRSSGWLRHSAALSLYQLGAFLQAAGQELDETAE